MQESRLFRIVYYLLNKGRSTAPELAEKFEVSVRTIYRDIDAISSAGIPVYATQGKGGGIFILEDFVMEKSLLSGQEKEQILMALQGMTAVDGKNSSELLTKLGSLFQTKTMDWIEVDFSDWVKKTAGQEVFEELKRAIFGRHIVRFQYFGGSGEFTERRAEPVKLVFKSKDWYLYGYCLLRNDYRLFKLTRIRQLEIQPETYSREIPESAKAGIKLEKTKTISVKLKFDQKAAFRVYDEFTDQVTKDSQGNLYVETELPENDILYSYLFTFADLVEVLEPEFVRQKVRKKLTDIHNKYRT